MITNIFLIVLVIALIALIGIGITDKPIGEKMKIIRNLCLFLLGISLIIILGFVFGWCSVNCFKVITF